MITILNLLLFLSAGLFGGWLLRLPDFRYKNRNIPIASFFIHGLGLFAFLWYATTEQTLPAWLFCIWLFIISFEIEQFLFLKIKTRILLKIVFGLLVTLTIIWIGQLETNFSEEEFYTFLQWIVLFIIWMINDLLYERVFTRQKDSRFVYIRWGVGGLTLITFFAIIVGLIRTYQLSFFPPDAPSFPGVSTKTPFLCGDTQSDSTQYSSLQVHQQYIELIAKNPQKETPDYGFLALATREPDWLDEFKKAILSDAESQLFTQPVNSVKYSQYQAALTAYYYAQVREIYPGLFSDKENEFIESWFADINQRALTVEWVDLFYALAFSKFPEGPYENQEIGAGLLSLLQRYNLAHPQLQNNNLDYLSRSIRGWITRFRNTDDSAFYQPEWQDNALFQYLFTGELNPDNLLLSNEWLLLQAPPDGSFLQYNQPSPADLPGSFIRGASMTKDPRFLWLAGKSVGYLKENNLYLHARPGSESAPNVNGIQPDIGSCLLFGNSGLPNQQGPLAPDKIVFRQGWSDDSTYVLGNLRFTGWHRYKATNTIVSIHKNGSVILEKVDGETASWLPVGRSLFRDKRIPRENLNGLSIPRSGIDKVISLLTGIGSQWAQDPPYYAHIDNFSTTDLLDTGTIRISEWRGWSHTRTISLFHNGPLVVIDTAIGPDLGDYPAIFWHFPLQSEFSGNRVQIDIDGSKAEMVFISFDRNPTQNPKITFTRGNTNSTIQYSSSEEKQLNLATIFLFDSWVNAKVWSDSNTEGLTIHIQTPSDHIELPVDTYDK